MEYIQKLDDFLHKDNAIAHGFAKIEEKTNVPRRYFAFGLIGFLVVYLMFGWGAQFLANFIGFLYPAYASVKAIESSAKEDDTQWLTYWVVYAAFGLLETFTDILLFWIPLYAFLKCALLIYLMAPIASNGSVLIYTKLIRPFVLKHQARIDQGLSELHSSAKKLANEATAEAVKRSVDYAVKDD